MKKIIFAIAIFISLSNISFGQAAGNVIYNNHDAVNPQRMNVNLNKVYDFTTELSAEVLMNIPASSYSVIFSATQNGTSATQADSFMNVRIRTVQDELMKIGIKKSEIHIDLISFVPTYSLTLETKRFSKTANEIPVGFQLKKNIHVLIFNYDLLTELTSIMAKSEIYDIVKVDYNLDNLKEYFRTIRAEAIQIIKTKEGDYKKMGLRLDIENMYDGFNATYPLERYASYTAYYTGSSIEEIKVARKRKEESKKNTIVTGKNAIVNINVVNKGEEDDTEFIVKYSDKNKTIYYNKIPFNQFDMVINADFTEPRIQIVYSLKAKYKVENLDKFDKREKQITDNEEKLQLEKGKKRRGRTRVAI